MNRVSNLRVRYKKTIFFYIIIFVRQWRSAFVEAWGGMAHRRQGVFEGDKKKKKTVKHPQTTDGNIRMNKY